MKFKQLFDFSGLFGVVKIALIFVGVFLCLLIVVPCVPFAVIYFVYDRNRTHKERMYKVKKKKQKSINEWANE